MPTPPPQRNEAQDYVINMLPPDEGKPWRIIPPEYAEPDTVKRSVAEQATDLVEGHRQKDYGAPHIDLGRTARLWSALFDYPFTASDVSQAMRLLKESRLRNSPRHRDSLVDIVGYALTQEMIWEKDEPYNPT